MAKTHLIYIPTFGDHLRTGQKTLINLWRLFGVVPHYCPVIWRSQETYDAKLAKVLKLIDQLSDKGYQIGIVGASAGASLAMNAYSERRSQIKRAVFISGKLVYPETVQESYFHKNPAFRKSVFDADANFKKLSMADRAKMVTMYAIADNTVPVRASRLPGVRAKRTIAIGHIPAIYITIIFYSHFIAKFIRS